MTKHVDSKCDAFQAAIELLARPWTAVILNALQGGALRFSEFGEHAEGIGDKVLSARLKELESRGLLVRSVDPGPPVKVLYELTPQGRAFNEVAVSIESWGQTLVDEEGAP